jgi:hypothetical protein
VSAERVRAFTRGFLAFSRGKTVSDVTHAPGIEIGRAAETYRRIRIESMFGKMTVLVTDGHLPYPYGRETTGYEVADLTGALTKAKAAGAAILVGPYMADQRSASMVQFPGGYLAEVHSPASRNQVGPPARSWRSITRLLLARLWPVSEWPKIRRASEEAR